MFGEGLECSIEVRSVNVTGLNDRTRSRAIVIRTLTKRDEES